MVINHQSNQVVTGSDPANGLYLQGNPEYLMNPDSHFPVYANQFSPQPRGEIYEKIPETKGQKVIIDLVGKFPLSDKASLFFEKASAAIYAAGFKLQF